MEFFQFLRISYFNGVIDIDAFKANPPNYTPTFQCTSAAVSMAAKIGVSLPSGVGPTKARKYFTPFTTAK